MDSITELATCVGVELRKGRGSVDQALNACKHIYLAFKFHNFTKTKQSIELHLINIYLWKWRNNRIRSIATKWWNHVYKVHWC